MLIANSICAGAPERAKPLSVQREEPATASLPARLTLVRAGSAAEPLHEPVPGVQPVPKLATLSPIDAQLIAILEAECEPHQTALVGFARKEVQMKTLLATLSLIESLAMHKRLSNPMTTDKVAAKFSRFTAERRNRIVQFLAKR
ncbi:hypothetical protein BH11MYX1_BH11MYX1_53660 [soil metagenome]